MQEVVKAIFCQGVRVAVNPDSSTAFEADLKSYVIYAGQPDRSNGIEINKKSRMARVADQVLPSGVYRPDFHVSRGLGW